MANSNGKQQVSPGLLIICGIALVAGGIYYFTSMPKSQSNVQTSNAASMSNLASLKSPEKNQNLGQPKYEEGRDKDKNQKESNGTAVLLSRNPFLTPSIYLKNDKVNVATTPVSETITPIKTPTPITTKTTTTNETPDKPREPEIRLGATFEKANDRVALIYFDGKGYILREKDYLKRTGLRLKKINSEFVVLQDNNGDEKILRLSKTQ